ncbi:MAG TPA: HlyD family efflux transporter periplasmic adaptor subunit [Anaerolineales bacterium]|nr:HlyD family efflux transporter periplasmic adaptor subunit [Anaerolineales bacterium]
MSNYRFLIPLMWVSLLLTACSTSGNPAAGTPGATPTVGADSPIIAEGRMEPIRFADIAFNTSGVVSELLAEEGQPVKKGELLVHLGDESDTNYAAAQLELVSAQKALNDLQNTGGEDLAQVVIDMKDAGEEYDDAVDYLNYLKNEDKVPQTETLHFLIQNWKGYYYESRTKHFKGPVPQDWIIEAQNDLALKKAKFEDLKRTYERMKGGIDKDQLAVLEARLNAAKARVAAFSVVAPFDGVVADLNAKQGSSINAGQVAVTVADFSDWLVKTTDLTEIDVVKLSEDQPVVVTLEALPKVELHGTILSIGQSYSENQGDVVYEVTVLLTDTDPAMRWGMTAEVKFDNQD